MISRQHEKKTLILKYSIQIDGGTVELQKLICQFLILEFLYYLYNYILLLYNSLLEIAVVHIALVKLFMKTIYGNRFC